MIEQKLRATIPKQCKWLECAITSKAKELKVTNEIISDNELAFAFGLFRRNESFSFQALLLLDENHSREKIKKFVEEIKWYHRIANLGQIKIAELPSTVTDRKRVWLQRLTWSIIGFGYLLIAVLFFWGIDLIGLDKPIVNHLIAINGEYKEYNLSPNKDGTTTIKAVDSEFEEIVNLQEYVQKNKVIPVVSTRSNRNYYIFGMIMLLLLGGIGMIYSAFEKDIKRIRLKRLIISSYKET